VTHRSDIRLRGKRVGVVGACDRPERDQQRTREEKGEQRPQSTHRIEW